MTSITTQQTDLPIKEKLNLETALLKWKELQICFAQGKLLTVDPSCDLIDVAAQISGDLSKSGANQIESLIDKNLIQFATPNWIRENCNEETLLWTVVVAPFVVSQLKVD